VRLAQKGKPVFQAASGGRTRLSGRRRASTMTRMIELLRTNDIVLISAVEALLRDAGVFLFVADQNMSVLEGSAGFLPRRLCVAEDQVELARSLLVEAGFGRELPNT